MNDSPVGGSTMELTGNATADFSSQHGNLGMLLQEQLGVCRLPLLPKPIARASATCFKIL